MNRFIALFVTAFLLSATGAFAQTVPYGTVDNTGKGIAGGYDPYDSYSPTRQLYRTSAVVTRNTGITGLAFGPRFYGKDRYKNFVTEESNGALGSYVRIINKAYDPEQRAYRGTRSRTDVLAGRSDAKHIPVYVGATLLE